MDPLALESPLLDSGIRSVNFFNGRLLTASDLRREQDVRRIHDRWLGQAIGDGVAWGLQVRKHTDSTVPEPLVTVEPGLAVNRDGQALCLKSQATVALVRKSKAAATVEVTFAQCGKLQTGTYVAGPGIYLLTIAPASSKEGKALTSGFDQYGGKCNTDAIVETVQFRLISLETDLADLDPANEEKLRNQAAYRCFGLQGTHAWSATRLAPGGAAPLLDALRGEELTACDVPLALLYWTLSGGIRFVDMWSVRRQLATGPAGDLLRLGGQLGGLAAAEARLFQFLDQAEALGARRPQQPAAINRDMGEFFASIPPAGLVPVTTSAASQGLSASVFFGARGLGNPTTISAAEALSVLMRSLTHPALAVETGMPLQLYWVRENLAAVQGGTFNQLYLVYSARSLHGFLERDLVAETLGQTWRAYSDLVRKAVVLPDIMTADSLPVWTALHTTQQTVVHFSVSREGLAASRALDAAAVKQAMSDLHGLQKQFTAALALTFTGDTGAVTRSGLAEHLNRMLDVALPGGGPGLAVAVSNSSLQQMMQAQREINALVSSYSGEIPFGHVQIAVTGRPRGSVLVPGDTTGFPFLIEVTNRTDKRTAIALTAEIVDAPSGSWGGAVSLQDRAALAAAVTTVTLNPDQMIPLQIVVRPPADAAPDQPVTLRLTAALPAPAVKSWAADIDLTTGTAAGPAVDWSLVHTVVARASGRTNAEPSRTYTFTVDTEFLASRAPTSASVTLTVTPAFTGGSTGWTVNVVGGGPVTGSGAGPFTYTVQLPATTNSGRERTSVEVSTPSSRPTGADRVCSFTLAAATSLIDPNTGATVAIASQPTETFSVTIRP